MCSWYTYKYILVLSWWPGVTAVTSTVLRKRIRGGKTILNEACAAGSRSDDLLSQGQP